MQAVKELDSPANGGEYVFLVYRGVVHLGQRNMTTGETCANCARDVETCAIFQTHLVKNNKRQALRFCKTCLPVVEIDTRD